MNPLKTVLALAVAISFVPATVNAAEPYPLDKCIVSNEPFGGEMGEPVDLIHEGRLIRFCCKPCIRKFKKDPAKYLKVLDDAIKAKGQS